MSEYSKLIEQCISKDEEAAIYELFVKIQCLKKHDRLRDIYKKK